MTESELKELLKLAEEAMKRNHEWTDKDIKRLASDLVEAGEKEYD